jgi:nicotinamidase-related amidase
VTGLERGRAALLVVDIQDRLVPAMPDDVARAVIKNTTTLVTAAALLGMPIACSQQYPKGLGPTIAAIEQALQAARARGATVHRFDKVEFSAAAAPAFTALAPHLPQNQWLVCGMEAHVCVYQTARDLAARGAEVHVVADAVCSRAKPNWKRGLDLAAAAGATITSTEVCIFDLLRRAGTDEFKALSLLIR